MIKKGIVVLATTAMVLVGGCGNEAATISEQQNTPAAVESEIEETDDNLTAVEVNIENEKEYDRSLVCNRWSDSGSFKIYTSDEEYIDYSFDYSVPQIIDDTEDAKEINYFIECLYGDMHNTIQKASKEGQITAQEFDSTGWILTDYDCYWNGSIASIVICSTGYFDNSKKYNVYNYDFADGKQLSNEDIFALKGISGEKFVENVRRAAVYTFDKDMQQFFEFEMPLTGTELWSDVLDENKQLMYGDYLLSRARTINFDNINEDIPVFLDAQGELQAVTHFFDMGLYGEVNLIISPIEWINNNVMVSSGELLDVESGDDGIYLTINRDEWLDSISEEYPTFDFAKRYRIDGLWKNYTDARISLIGNLLQPYILLLSDDGMISYIDVREGIAHGYFCAVEPLWGVEDISAFSDDVSFGVQAVNNAGMTVDVEGALCMMINCRSVKFEKNLLNLGNMGRYSATVTHNVAGQDVEYEEYIGFTDDLYNSFIRESYRTEDYEGGAQVGNITFCGMNEKGMVYIFSIVGDEGAICGTMALKVYKLWDADYLEYMEGAEVISLSGFDIFESDGKWVMLHKSFG